jgi:hypothetical protein
VAFFIADGVVCSLVDRVKILVLVCPTPIVREASVESVGILEQIEKSIAIRRMSNFLEQEIR